MKRKISFVLTMAALIMSLTDFSSLTDTDPLESALLVSAMSIGQTDGEYDIGFIYADYSAEAGKNEYKIVKYSSDSVGGCISGAERTLQAKIYFGQMDAVFIEMDVFGDEKIYRDVINCLERNPYMGYSIYVYGFDGDIDEFNGKIEEKDEKYVKFLEDIIIREPMKGAFDAHLLDIVSAYSDYAIPVITPLGDDMVGKMYVMNGNKYISQADSGYFRPYGILNDIDGRYYYETPLGEFYTDKVRTRMSYDGGMSVTVFVDIDFSSMYLNGYTSLQGKMISVSERQFSEAVKKDIYGLIDHMKRSRCDMTGIKEYMHRFHNAEYADMMQSGRDIVTDGYFEVVVRSKFINNGVMY